VDVLILAVVAALFVGFAALAAALSKLDGDA
jgi:hypothetical protein